VAQRGSKTTSSRSAAGAARGAGHKALASLSDSIDSAQAALKDLRSEMGRGSSSALKDVEGTLKDARKHLTGARRRIAKELDDAQKAVAKRAPSARKPAARKTTARKTTAAKSTARKSAAAKPTARKPAARKPAAKKTTATRSRAAAKK
jgi:hypothetical protein